MSLLGQIARFSIAVCCFAFVGLAFAQEVPAGDPSDEVARRLFEAGRTSFEAGEYEDALKFFEQSYLRSRRPRLLYNIGQTADRLRNDRKAINSFKGYLAAVPDADNRVEVENRIRALERTQNPYGAPTPAQTARAGSSVPPDQAASHVEATSDSSVTKQWWFWTAIGAVLVTGVVVAVAASSGDSFEATPGGTDGVRVSTLVAQ